MDAEKERVKLTNQQLAQVNKIYSDVADDFAKEIKKLEGRDNISSILRTQYLQNYQRELSNSISLANQNVEANLTEGVRAMAQAVVNENQTLLNGMGLNIAQAYSYVPDYAVRSIVSGQLYESNWSLSSAIWGTNQKQLNDIQTIVAKGMAENKSVYSIAKDLEKYVDPNAKKEWDWGKVYPGTNQKIDYNAQRLARTMTSHAYQYSLQRVTKNNPFIDAYKWNNAGGHVCELCQDRATRDDYGLGSGIFPKDNVPLDHPNGMCYLTLVQTKSLEEVGDALGDWVVGNGDPELNAQIDNFARDMGYTSNIVKSKVDSANAFGTDKWYNSSFEKITKGMTQEQKDELVKGLKNGTEGYQKAFAKASKNSKFKGLVNIEKGSYYSCSDKFVNIDLAAIQKQAESYGLENKMHTLFHEMGHAIDSNTPIGTKYSQSVKFTEAFKNDVKKIFTDYEKTHKNFNINFNTLLKNDNSRGIQDIFSGLNNVKEIENVKNPFYDNKIRTKWSHSNSYWTRGNVEDEIRSELFAHLSAAQASPTQKEMMQNWFPNSLAAFEDILK
jgi:hypothetical protein